MIHAADGACALHAGTPATFTCPRCGAFGCPDCERRTRPDAFPICPDCWERREAVAAKNATTNEMMLPNLALGLGLLGLVPLLTPAWIGAAIVGVVALRRLPEPHPGRPRAALGVALAPLGLLVTAVTLLVWLDRRP